MLRVGFSYFWVLGHVILGINLRSIVIIIIQVTIQHIPSNNYTTCTFNNGENTENK